MNSTLFKAHSIRQPVAGGIMHADHGTQLTAWAFTRNVAQRGLRFRYGTFGDCYDNAMIEAFGGRVLKEVLERKKRATIPKFGTEIADSIDAFHNTNAATQHSMC